MYSIWTTEYIQCYRRYHMKILSVPVKYLNSENIIKKDLLYLNNSIIYIHPLVWSSFHLKYSSKFIELLLKYSVTLSKDTFNIYKKLAIFHPILYRKNWVHGGFVTKTKDGDST